MIFLKNPKMQSILLLFPLGLTIIALNCNQSDSKLKKVNDVENIRQSDPVNKNIIQSTEYRITSNEFALNPFPRMPNPKNIIQTLNLKFELNKVPLINVHDNKVDTVYCFSYKNSKVNFYISSSKQFFQDATIVDDEILLSKGIKIGMTKDDFLKKFGVNDVVHEDIIVISDDEDFISHKILFKKNLINIIILRMGVD